MFLKSIVLLVVLRLFSVANRVEVMGSLPPGLLHHSQVNAWRRSPEVAAAAVRGMAAAAAECRHQFRAQRWNCSVLGGGGGRDEGEGGGAVLLQKSSAGRGLPQGGYREVAFARAILTAGIVLQVAKECSIGLLNECTCEPRGWTKNWNNPRKSSSRSVPKVHWKWRGCSQALDFGLDFSKEFMDATEIAQDAPSRVHLHNSNVGRLAVMSLMKISCKCHGMSGSCSLRTCWQAPPDLKHVGMALKSRFNSAVMVTTDNMNGDLMIRPVAEDELTAADTLQRLPTGASLLRRRRGSSTNTISLDEQLLYIERSPSFCERDSTADVPGTSGRRCRRDGLVPTSPRKSDLSQETDEQDCAIMCCGRGFDLVKASPSNCRCRFVWCCKVVCDVCSQQQDWVAVCK